MLDKGEWCLGFVVGAEHHVGESSGYGGHSEQHGRSSTAI